MKQKLLLLAAVFFGIIAFVLNYSQIQAERRKIQGSTESIDLIKMTRAIASGEVIREQDIAPDRVRRLRTESSGFSNEIRWSQSSRVIGRKLAISKEKNERIHWADIQQAYSRASGLAGVVRKNYRAISISVDSVSAVTNLIKPGDNVDIIGTFRFPEMRGDNNLDTLTLTILQNVKILATGSNWNVNSSEETRSGYSTVTLELSPKEVEMIIFASQKGKLSLSLRNFEESGFTQDLQSVNFKYFEQNIPAYNQERESRQRIR
ncbi:MAG: Flp pilus assembly protein CpaB [Lentisphaerae bacterium]|nr:Flp pilus assembly protein CpaB [Lentisphaerota bacterium]